MDQQQVLVPVNFDPDFSPGAEVNQRAAAMRKVTYDWSSRVYRDAKGHARYDEYGNPL